MQSKEVWCPNIEEECQRGGKEHITFRFKIQQNYSGGWAAEYKGAFLELFFYFFWVHTDQEENLSSLLTDFFTSSRT